MQAREDDMDKGGTKTNSVGEKFDATESIAELYTNGIVRLAEIQKKNLEIAVKHNAELANALKKQTLPVPGAFMLDFVTAAFEHYAEAQKDGIDLVVEQTHAFAGLVKDRKVYSIEDGKKKAKEAIAHTIEVQKTALDFTAKQTKLALDAEKQQFGYSGTPVSAAADSMQRGMDLVVEAQKNVLDVLAEPALR
jgi:hypothetical protein